MTSIKLFNGIVSDLFPKIRDVPVDYGEMELSIRARSLEAGLEDIEGWQFHYRYLIVYCVVVKPVLNRCVMRSSLYAHSYWGLLLM